MQIHPTAIVYDGASIGADSVIGPYSVIGPRVKMGARNQVAPHVVIEGNTTIGDDNQFFQFCSVGSRPQDLKFQGEDSTLEIGSRNIIREYATLQPGTKGGGMRTVIGDENLFMANSHVGHDSFLGSGNILANSTSIAGHVTLGNNVILGGLSGVHQFVKIGDLAFTGAGSMVAQDIPPFCMAQGDRAILIGLNKVGMQRKGYSAEDVSKIKKLYRALFFGEGTMRSRIEALTAEAQTNHATKLFLDFITASKRGVVLPRGDNANSGEE